MTYEAEIDRVVAFAAREFSASERSDTALSVLTARYLALGKLAGVSQGELIDFLGVSSPSVLELAGYTDEEQKQVMALLGKLSDEEIHDQEKRLA
jgi:hypothetical protein